MKKEVFRLRVCFFGFSLTGHPLSPHPGVMMGEDAPPHPTSKTEQRVTRTRYLPDCLTFRGATVQRAIP